VERYGLKNDSKPMSAQSTSSEPEEARICQIHQVPMTQVNGKEGPFWSYHEKISDGRWCSYTPSAA